MPEFLCNHCGAARSKLESPCPKCGARVVLDAPQPGSQTQASRRHVKRERTAKTLSFLLPAIGVFLLLGTLDLDLFTRLVSTFVLVCFAGIWYFLPFTLTFGSNWLFFGATSLGVGLAKSFSEMAITSQILMIGISIALVDIFYRLFLPNSKAVDFPVSARQTRSPSSRFLGRDGVHLLGVIPGWVLGFALAGLIFLQNFLSSAP